MLFWRKQDFKSALYNQDSFYAQFVKDLKKCKKEVLIESPYLTSSRIELLYAVFEELLSHGAKVHIVTRDPIDHDDEYVKHQATNEILNLKELGINVILLKGFHHRKIAIIDRNILWEGSLNILSYNSSLEIMRRIENERMAKQMLSFLKVI